MMKRRLALIALAVLLGFSLAALAVYVQKSAPGTAASGGNLIPVTDDAFGGPFTLTDNTGKKVTDKDFTGKYRLIYFGFTYCPAICPTELSKLTAVMNILGDRGKEVLPLFITVDPERDTPEKMKNYVSLFHPSLVGLSGTPEQIKTVLKGYKVYAAKRVDPAMSDYTMDHSSYIYFLAPDDRLLHIFKMEDNAQTMSGIVTQWLDQKQQ